MCSTCCQNEIQASERLLGMVSGTPKLSMKCLVLSIYSSSKKDSAVETIDANAIISVQQKQPQFDSAIFWQLSDDLCDVIEMINSTFTAHLIVVLVTIMVIEILGGYAFLREGISKVNHPIAMTAGLLWIAFNNVIKLTMVYAGSSTTDEAEKSLVLISKLAMKGDERSRNDLKFVSSQLQIRNKKFRNIFFAIDYNAIVVVSFNSELHIKYVSKFKIPDLFYGCYVFGNNWPV